MRGRKSPLMQTMFSKKSDASITLGKRLGVKNGLGSVAKLRLRSNILEGNNRAVGSRARRHGMSKNFTIRYSYWDTK